MKKKVTVPFINGVLRPELMEMGWNGQHKTNEIEHFYFDTKERCLLDSEKHKENKFSEIRKV